MAASEGMTLQQLSDAVAESGLLALPPSDGITQRYTLEDLGLKFWGEMQAVPRNRRKEWFQTLVPTQQIALVVVLRDRGKSTQTLANELGVHPLEISRVWNKHADELGAQVVGLRLDTIAGQIQLESERAQEVAMDKGDASTYWRIAKDRVSVYQGLGIVDRAIHKVEHTHKFDEQQKQEIEALLDLRQKKERRLEEIKQIESEEFDVVAETPLEAEEA